MPWSTSTRRATLPKDWHKRRAHTWRNAGGRCQWVEAGRRCTWTGRLNGDRGQVDHIIRGAGDQPSNLQWLCPDHHTAKTQGEATAARPRLTRQPAKHPGLR